MNKIVKVLTAGRSRGVSTVSTACDGHVWKVRLREATFEMMIKVLSGL